MELASIQEKLKEEGWNLSNSGLEMLSENGKVTNLKYLIQKAVDVDLKTISEGILPEDVNRTKYEQIPGQMVLQIQKIKNLSQPKASDSNYALSNILKLTLTDGVQNVLAILMEPIEKINPNTLPGSKIHITSENIDVSNSYLLLNSSNTRFLGGKVIAMVEKWEMNKQLANHTRDRNGEGGPPPWIGFGRKIVKPNMTDKNFKSLELSKNRESSENSEFEAQRKDAILEATKIGSTKVFGGGNNKLLDHNVQQIVDAGFSIEEAEYALKISKNNVDRALRNLQNKYNKANKEDGPKSNKTGVEEKKGGRSKGRHKDEDSVASLRPSGNVSLFEYLETKLNIPETVTETKPVPEKRNGVPLKTSNKPNYKGNIEKGKFSSSDKKPGEKFDSRFAKKNYESPKSYPKSDIFDKKSHPDKKSEMGKFEHKKGFEGNPRNDKSFGNFKSKYEAKNGDGKSEFYKNKPNDKRGPNNLNQSSMKVYGRSTDVNENKKVVGFGQANEKPPRFQKYQSQQNDTPTTQNWNDLNYDRMQQSDFQLQNNLANLTLQQNIASFQNQNSQDGYGDLLTSVQNATPKANNMFFQNIGLPTGQSNESRHIANQNSQPPTHQSHLNAFTGRNLGGFLHQNMKNSNFPSMANVQDVAFKNNGASLHGFNDFQSVFGNARAPSSNYPNPQYLSSDGNGMPPHQAPKTWLWNKGDKCMARYWEDAMYYNAVVTAVSDNTCVVRFTGYGNYEEVLQNHCIPITEES